MSGKTLLHHLFGHAVPVFIIKIETMSENRSLPQQSRLIVNVQITAVRGELFSNHFDFGGVLRKVCVHPDIRMLGCKPACHVPTA